MWFILLGLAWFHLCSLVGKFGFDLVFLFWFRRLGLVWLENWSGTFILICCRFCLNW